MMTGRYLAGFDDSNHTLQPPEMPNHVAWNLGHCALTMHRCCERIMNPNAAPGTGELPASDFVAEGSAREAGAFLVESVAFGSRPSASREAYPKYDRCVEIYRAACERFAAACRAATDAQLDARSKWGPSEIPVWAIAQRMIFHNGFHTGQISDVRRALGFKSIFA